VQGKWQGIFADRASIRRFRRGLAQTVQRLPANSLCGRGRESVDWRRDFFMAGREFVGGSRECANGRIKLHDAFRPYNQLMNAIIISLLVSLPQYNRR